MYTILGLLIVEEFGPDFTTEQVGKAWLKYLPFACTAEKIALGNLKAGVSVQETGEKKYNYLTVYTPDTRESIAMEPWTCPPDAFNNGMDLIVLAPEEEISLTFGIALE